MFWNVFVRFVPTGYTVFSLKVQIVKEHNQLKYSQASWFDLFYKVRNPDINRKYILKVLCILLWSEVSFFSYAKKRR